MSKASESKLGELHGLIADHMVGKLEDGEMSAAELAVAVKFLKDNSITVDPELNKALNDMEQALKNRRRTMTSKDQADAMAAVARDLLQ